MQKFKQDLECQVRENHKNYKQANVLRVEFCGLEKNKNVLAQNKEFVQGTWART